MTDQTYRSRWGICEECECVLIVERDDDRGVPDEGEWELFTDCPVCDSTIGPLNADENTQVETERRRGQRRRVTLAVDVLRTMARDLEAVGQGHIYIGTPDWLRESADLIEKGGAGR